MNRNYPLDRFTRDITDAFAPSVRTFANSVMGFDRNNKIPVDIASDNKHIYLYAEIPGVDLNDIDVDVYNNKLTISITKEKKYDNMSMDLSELLYGSFQRTVTLPICVTKKGSIDVEYKNGVLFVKINKLSEEENKFSVKPILKEE